MSFIQSSVRKLKAEIKKKLDPALLAKLSREEKNILRYQKRRIIVLKTANVSDNLETAITKLEKKIRK